MSSQVQRLVAGSSAFLVVGVTVAGFVSSCQPAEARGRYYRGARGAAGGWTRQGTYGQTAGFGARAYGKGGFFGTKTSLAGAGGSTYNGYRLGKYNAQTGQGAYASGKQVYNAKNGNTYGYNQNTAYTKGQGGTTTLDTQNKGDYTVEWAKGQKPVVTPVPAP